MFQVSRMRIRLSLPSRAINLLREIDCFDRKVLGSHIAHRLPTIDQHYSILVTAEHKAIRGRQGNRKQCSTT